MNSDWAAKKAEELAKVLDEIPWRQKNDRYAILATALRDAARVPEGHVRTPDGVVREVVGTLPIMADQRIYGHQHPLDPPVYGITSNGKVVPACVRAFPRDDTSFRPDECYFTREAAEAARSKRFGQS